MKRFLWISLLSAAVLLLFSLGVLSLTEKSVAAREVPSPSDWIRENQIHIYKQGVVLDIANPIWTGFTNTNSMDPFIDESAHGIEILPEKPESINVGDVISFSTPYGIIVHRVIERGEDKDGIYYLVQGDNNSQRDDLKVRFTDVTGVLVAVIY